MVKLDTIATLSVRVERSETGFFLRSMCPVASSRSEYSMSVMMFGVPTSGDHSSISFLR